jgi:hypothetical protein
MRLTGREEEIVSGGRAGVPPVSPNGEASPSRFAAPPPAPDLKPGGAGITAGGPAFDARRW